MPDYSKGKIYKLTSSNSDEVYIGSTTQSLAMRKGGHKGSFNRYKNNKGAYITSFKLFEHGGNIDICLLEEFPCENKEQLHARERYHIENNQCVNKCIPNRKMKEYQNTHTETLKEYNKSYQKKYRETHIDSNFFNKGKMAEYAKQYYIYNKTKLTEKINCESCNGRYLLTNKFLHFKTKKHILSLKKEII